MAHGGGWAVVCVLASMRTESMEMLGIRLPQLLDLHSGIPSLEHCAQFLVAQFIAVCSSGET